MGDKHSPQQPPPPPQPQSPSPLKSPVDTTLTKVFVGGIAWETQKEVLRDYFHQFGDIIEAVIITDKLTGRSKGYGFVTFKEAEAAKKACEDAAPVINGRKTNCNLAFLGAKRGGVAKISPPATPGQPPSYPAARTVAAPPPPISWYFPTVTPQSASPAASPYHLHYATGVVPLYATAYGYSPSFSGTNMGYRTTKAGNSETGPYISGQFSYPAHSGIVAPIAITPAYHPMYHFHHGHHQPHYMASGSSSSIGIPAVNFCQSPAAAGFGQAPPQPAAQASPAF